MTACFFTLISTPSRISLIFLSIFSIAPFSFADSTTRGREGYLPNIFSVCGSFLNSHRLAKYFLIPLQLLNKQINMNESRTAQHLGFMVYVCIFDILLYLMRHVFSKKRLFHLPQVMSRFVVVFLHALAAVGKKDRTLLARTLWIRFLA